ncbi:MAG TPA: NUDIX domain-containing protein [Actinomycetes bacterium]|nr:NUDIX domain-containing protein [Actinomycetes bacterium]
MPRAPFQILVLPFRRTVPGEFEVAVLQRADDANWQGVAGGGQVGESVVQAARREALEEAGVPATAPLYALKTHDTVPVSSFAAKDQWPPGTYVIPQHCFACDLTGIDIALSHEHTAVRWASLDQAYALLRYDSNKNALWELAERLRRDDLPQPCGDA